MQSGETLYSLETGCRVETLYSLETVCRVYTLYRVETAYRVHIVIGEKVQSGDSIVWIHFTEWRLSEWRYYTVWRQYTGWIHYTVLHLNFSTPCM
jgi:hypothetical protein